jgi:NAD(P)-dependent dehydrogenase (short-subunit alcohol dehydrogenase family)
MTNVQTKTILVTGANRGIGFATAKELALRGHRVFLTSRDRTAGQVAVDRIRAEMPGALIKADMLDLASFNSIRNYAARMTSDIRLDCIIHNAGVLIAAPERRLTEDGIEECLQVHTIGPMLLTALLRPYLSRPSRIIAVTSTLHAPGSRGAEVNFKLHDPNLDSGYHPERAYKNAKLAQLWFVLEWERRYGGKGWHADAVGPGFVPLTAVQSARGMARLLLKYVLPLTPLATSVGEAAAIEADWATRDPDAPGGLYTDRRNVLPASTDASDHMKAEAFWHLASHWIGPYFDDI